MAEQTPYVDDLDCGSFFDQIDDLIDFPSSDDVLSCPDGSYAQQTAATKGYDGGGSAFPPSIWAGQPGSDSVFSTNSASDLSAELSVPYEDIVQLEWLSTFVEDSFSGGGILGNIDIESSSLLLEKDLPSWSTRSQQQQSQTSSPVSVRESSSSSSGDGNPGAALSQDTNVGPRGRARSKRPRPPTFTPRPPMQHKVMKQRKQQKKMKLTTTAAAARVDLPNQDSAADQLQGVRKCMHCQMTKTPQWRAGPTGPKTLCNACGVRFKSGRLFPEYRPAASPTFVPSLHSNSHRKVIEMRTKGTTGRLAKGATMSTTSTVVAHSQDVLIPNHNNSVAMGYL